MNDRGILADFAANEIGWTQVLDKLNRAIRDATSRAAEADADEHLDKRGFKRGLEHAVTLIDECRKSLRRA